MTNLRGTDNWDVICIGAGVAGSFAAYLLAQSGLRVLLVEQHTFPRSKVCGGCLNGASITYLQDAGLLGILETLRSPTTRQLQLTNGTATATIPIAAGRSVSRRAFDAAMVEQAVAAGATFWDRTKATVQPADKNHAWRNVECQRLDSQVTLQSRIVLACDGLGHPSLRRMDHFRSQVKTCDSKIGLGCVIPLRNGWPEAETIHMAVGATGYVGCVRLENQQFNLAAAIDPKDVVARGAVPAICEILGEENAAKIVLESAVIQGTRLLSCDSARVAEARLFLVGDAMGYAEPFTGEGMTWALRSAQEVVPWVLQVTRGSLDPQTAANLGNSKSRQLGAPDACAND
ncbi:MAG: NAD(P)/FAD-dependent oxidoreductase [Pirellulaceae bacterium]